MTQPLAATLRPATPANRLIRGATLAVLGTAILLLASKIAVPLPPVPITMQTYAVLLIGMVYGARLGAATILLFIAEGLAGLPVFAGAKPGTLVLIGPTAGYIYGWVVAAFLVGWLGERGWGRSVPRLIAAMLAGNAVIYLFGLPWLAAFIGPKAAFTAGLAPFVIGDALKLVLAALTVRALSRITPPRGA